MDQKTLHQLSAQSCHWADDAIRNGRLPFRRAESFPPLLTADGEIAPPLVLWINRDSFMAGGVLFFPAQEAGDEDLRSGSLCAEALGLCHFATWDVRVVSFWESTATPRPIRSIPLPVERSLAAYRHLFGQILEEFKLLSVLGALPPDRLSPFCLVNLCRAARQEALPALAEGFRLASGKGSGSGCGGTRPEDAARRQGTLILLRLLALLLADRLAPGIQPEGLGKVLRFAVDALPPELAAVLAETAEEIAVPPESAIRFHHLSRRLLQLRFGGDRARAARVLEIMLDADGKLLGGFPLPHAAPQPPDLLLNPDRLPPEVAAVEIAPAPILAATTLIRWLRGISMPRVQGTDIFTIADLPTPDSICGSLRESGPPSAADRRALEVRLRRSWPHRRFALPSGSPRWAWEFLHLLGLAAPMARLDLETPDGWLTAPFGTPLLDVIRQQFTLEEMSSRPERRLRLRLRKEVRPGATTILHGPEGRRELPWSQLQEGPAALLPLALDLPDGIYSLLRSGLLFLEEMPLSPDEERGLRLFSNSSLGLLLQRTVSGGIPPSAQRRRAKLPPGLPRPSREALRHLHRACPQDLVATAAVIDAELVPWLGGAAPAVPAPCRPPGAGSRRRRHASGQDVAALLELARTDGIRLFPDHYLYDYFRPELREYRFLPPLTPGEEFFEQTILRDGAGEALTVEGSETARALRLAAAGKPRPISLPVDRRLTAAILDRYLDDLHRLRDLLVREAHRRLADPGAAEHLIEEVWSALALPPWTLVTG
jgi:hypothetical protein